MAEGFQGKGFETALLTATRWLLPPAVTTITLFILLAAFDVKITEQYLSLAVMQLLLVLFVFKEAYSVSSSHESIPKIIFTRALIPWLIVVALLIFIGFATKSSAEYSRRVLLSWFLQAPLLVAMAQDVTNKAIIGRMQSQGRGRRAVILGINPLAEQLFKTIRDHSEFGINVLGFFEDRSKERLGETTAHPILGRFSDLAGFIKSNSIDVIYLTISVQQQGRIADLLEELRDTTASIYLVPDIFTADLIQSRTDAIGQIPIVALCETPFYGTNALIKRTIDLLLGGIFLAIASPFMILIAIGIKLTSRGPVIFKQRRYGVDGQEIVVYKFRSMKVTEDADIIPQATQGDPRITAFGSFLRRSSLDEIPQLINVLQGRMSLVGPRPHAVAHNEMYRQLIKGYMVRHKVTPGITGLAQVKGWRGETEDLEAMERRVHYDLEYLRNWSVALDLEILFKTFFVVWKQDRAY